MHRALRQSCTACAARYGSWGLELRLRGGQGVRVSSLVLAKPMFKGMELATPSPESPWLLSVRAMASLMPTTLAQLESQRRNGTLSTVEIDIMNLIWIEKRIAERRCDVRRAPVPCARVYLCPAGSAAL